MANSISFSYTIFHSDNTNESRRFDKKAVNVHANEKLFAEM